MKNNKKIKTTLIVLIVILILVLCFNVGVYAAYALAATDVSYTKPNGTQTSVKEALDEVYAKVPSHEIGDEVTVGGEQFYVLEWDNNCDTVNLISKYNLNTAGTAQQNAAYGTTACAFSSTNYWSSSFTSSPFNLNDFIGYTATDAIGKAKSYGRSKGAVSSRLLSIPFIRSPISGRFCLVRIFPRSHLIITQMSRRILRQDCLLLPQQSLQ